jgi:hypothetical protein
MIYPNLMQLVGHAGPVFAPGASSLEPTFAEAAEEHARARRYRDSAVPLGLLLGLAGGLVVGLLRRR